MEVAMYDVDEFVASCRAALAEDQPQLAIKELLERAVSAPNEVTRALPPSRAEIVPLYASDDLTVLKVVWAPGMSFGPHNHLMWAAIGLYGGQEDNTFYRRSGPGIEVAGGRELQMSDVALLGADAIHAVSNPRRTYTGAIHIYGGNLPEQTGRSEWDEETFEEMAYDFARTQRMFEEAEARYAATETTAG
jgi:predicted metal-dependent enzyme (double-stranded beta helix superfamily)